MIRDCGQFDAWLDGGRDPSLENAARAHAAACPRCAGALELEALLAATPVARAGSSFTDGVLARIRDEESARVAARRLAAAQDSPWWLRAPAEPSAAMAMAAAALLAWKGDAVWSFALDLAARARLHDWARGPGAGVLDAIGRSVSASLSGTLASGALLAVLLPVVGLASWALYHVIEGVVADAGSLPGTAWAHGVSGAGLRPSARRR